MLHIAVRGTKRFSYLLAVTAALHLLSVPRVDAREQLCDPSYQNCRTPLIDLINAETVEIDVGLWFMEDARYSSAIVQKWKAGVKVRILMDPRVFPQDAPDVTVMNQLQAGGIPMRKRIASGIEHWKAMIFAGQRTVYFGSANFSDEAFVPASPYVNYVDETVYFTDDATVVNSFMRKFDDAWYRHDQLRKLRELERHPGAQLSDLFDRSRVELSAGSGLRSAVGQGVQPRDAQDRRDDVPHHRPAAH